MPILYSSCKIDTEFVVQTHPPLGIHICTRSQEDADGLRVALACSDVECGHSSIISIIIIDTIFWYLLLRGAPCSQCSLESSSVTCVGGSP